MWNLLARDWCTYMQTMSVWFLAPECGYMFVWFLVSAFRRPLPLSVCVGGWVGGWVGVFQKQKWVKGVLDQVWENIKLLVRIDTPIGSWEARKIIVECKIGGEHYVAPQRKYLIAFICCGKRTVTELCIQILLQHVSEKKHGSRSHSHTHTHTWALFPSLSVCFCLSYSLCLFLSHTRNHTRELTQTQPDPKTTHPPCIKHSRK